TFFQTGPFRPNNVDKRVPGLIFTGSSTLPGVGVPMVLVSGKLAAQRVDEYAQR
ncbi:MAG: phytoene desaturase, partial [Ilumatobacter sp.]